MSTADLNLLVTGKDQASKVLKDIDQSAGGLGKTLGDVGKIAGGFIAANVVASAGSALVGFLGDSVTAASNLGESINAVNVVFGDSAQKIHDWGANAAEQAGMSQRAFNQLATPLGAMLKNTGMDMDQVADSTIDLTKRAADMASVFNTDVEDALTAIQAALRGESDPIEKYGVAMNAAKIEAKALADTGKETASSLTDQEKAAARLALIFEQTAAVENDFINTSGEFANSQRIAAARTEELQAQIGEKMIPIMAKFTEAKLALVAVIADKVIPYLEELYAKHWPAIEAAIQSVIAFIQTNWPTIEPIIAAAIDFVRTKIEGFIQTLEGIIQIVTGVVGTIDAIFKGDWSAAWENMKLVAEGILNVLIGNIKQTFGSIPDILLGLMVDFAHAAGQLGQKIADKIMEFVNSIPGKVKSALSGLPGIIAGSIPGGSLVAGAVNFATGNAAGDPNSAGGMRWVGEEGPELVRLPQGARVWSHGDSMAMAGGRGGDVNIYLQPQGSILSERDLIRVFRDELQRGGLRDVIRAATA